MADTAEFTQARIRVNEEGAQEALDALYQRETFLLDARDAVRGARGEGLTKLNRRLTALRRVIEEAERTMQEHGWPLEAQDGEPQRPDA